MAGKRKRTRRGREDHGQDKRQRISEFSSTKNPIIKSAVLAQYYHAVQTLREYLLSKLPATSKVRKRKILSVGRKLQVKEGEVALAKLLDETLVGVLKHPEVSQKDRAQQWNQFSQRLDTSDSNIGNTSGIGRFSQLEVGLKSCIYSIWEFYPSHSLTSFPDRGLRHLALIL